MEERPTYRRPTSIERVFNRLFGWLAAHGIGLAHNYALETRGRRSGHVRRTPVNLLEVDGHHYLVAPRGETHWVRNLRAQPQLVLVHGRRRHTLLARELAEAEKPALLRIYLQRFAPTVQRYFAVTPDAPTAAFAAVGPAYPVFELTPCG
ncbi:MAG: nitroreductase family deazaflavin-dependent oxidoreductase [Gammaproteobacteria bacterium]|nr:nitroreductase family deazaflavin-dependent oxidoreductase [Gammaproteobacteria bacterium]MCP5199963.1 nitroreductase family deazaflavin-dependent oxidoreductase [Gammaproteobacteria bacterium]